MIRDKSGEGPQGELARPRCPRCGALVSMRVSGFQTGLMSGGGRGMPQGLNDDSRGLAGPQIRISMPCGYQTRNAGMREPCRQPIVIVFTAETPSTPVRYTFPPDWPTANTLTDEQLVQQYARG